MVLAGAWSRHPVYVAVATLGMVLGAVYILLTYKRTMTGPLTQATKEHVTTDLTGLEKAALTPLVILLLVFGFFPRPMLHVIEPVAHQTMSIVGVTDPAPAAEEGVK